MNTLVFTCGDINGIGPEICIKAINHIYPPRDRKIIFVCPSNVFESASSVERPSFSYKIIKDKLPPKIDSEFVTVFDIGAFAQSIGKPTKDSGKASYTALLKAHQMLKQKSADAMITAPVSKAALKLARINAPGQTEILAKLSNSKKFLMVFLSEELICGLATIHEPISNVSRSLKIPSLKLALQVLHSTLSDDLGINSPRIAVLSLNPHAGEDGNIGKEEITIIKPALKASRSILCDGPFVPDAFFGTKKFQNYDAVLGMYHDQVLIPFKLLNFNSGVNFTAGLPIIRTSPDHGTGYDIAGQGSADPRSMLEAVNWAERIILNRRKHQSAR